MHVDRLRPELNGEGSDQLDGQEGNCRARDREAGEFKIYQGTLRGQAGYRGRCTWGMGGEDSAW